MTLSLRKTNNTPSLPPSQSFRGANSSHAKDTGSGSRTYHIPNYATSYASEGSKLIAVTIDEDRGSNRMVLMMGCLGVFLIAFAALPLTVLALRGVHPERTPAGWHDAWYDGGRRQDAMAANWPQNSGGHAYRQARDEGRSMDEERDLELYWDEPRPSVGCLAYGTRDYTARLWNIPHDQDGTRACQRAKMKIHGIVHDKPSRCEYRGLTGGVIGHWEVKNAHETDCLPSWGTLSKEGCLEGASSHQRRVKARLQGVQKGDDWMKLCTTTPAEIDGQQYLKPSYCEKGIWGVYGVWEIEDKAC